MKREETVSRPECVGALTRRGFVKTVGRVALVAGTAPLLARAGDVVSTKPSAETAVKALYDSLNEKQKKEICFPFENELRHRINANWSITSPEIGGDFYTDDQRKLIDTIFRGVTSEDGYERFLRQMADDTGGFDRYHVAIFGKPGAEKFEWEMTGRHLTIRADGNSVDGMAFGGPIVYGHGEGNTGKNLFHYQTKKANEVFAALDGKQREEALLKKAPRENDVPLQGKDGAFNGIAVGELSADQKNLIESVLKVILAPYRKEDIDEALKVLEAGGGLEKLHMAFYQTGDLDDDQVWDIWRVEGPSFVWHFRGAPHVHSYVNIGVKTGGTRSVRF